MRFPWIQVEQDALERIPALATWLKLDEDTCEGKLMRAWRWGLTLAPTDMPPDGVCRDPDAPQILAAEMRFAGDPDLLVRALRVTGFLEVLPDGIRVRGMSRYRRTWEKNARRKGSKTDEPAETGGKPAKTGTVPAPQTQTQTQKKQLRTTTACASGVLDLDFDQLAAGANSDGRIFEDDEPLTLSWFLGWVGGFREHKGMIAEHPDTVRGLTDFWAQVEESGCANGRIQRAFADWMHGDWGPRQKPLSAFIPPTVWRQRIGPKPKPVVHEVHL
jgi:hypothetical protein